jgi:hypothetical protein
MIRCLSHHFQVQSVAALGGAVGGEPPLWSDELGQWVDSHQQESALEPGRIVTYFPLAGSRVDSSPPSARADGAQALPAGAP